MSVRISLTAPSLAAASVVINAAGGIDGITDFSYSSVSPNDTANDTSNDGVGEFDCESDSGYATLGSDEASSYQDNDFAHRTFDRDPVFGDTKNVFFTVPDEDEERKAAERDYIRQGVCDPTYPFMTLADEDAADAYAAEQAAFDAFDDEWLESLMRMAGINDDDDDDDDETQRSVSPCTKPVAFDSTSWDDGAAARAHSRLARVQALTYRMFKAAENVKNGADLLLLRQGEALLTNVAYQTQLSDVKEENLELKQAHEQSQAENAALRKMVEEGDMDRLTLLLRLGEYREDGAKIKVQLEEALAKVTSLRQELISATIDSCALLEALENDRFYLVARGLRTSNVKLVHVMEDIQAEMQSESS